LIGDLDRRIRHRQRHDVRGVLDRVEKLLRPRVFDIAEMVNPTQFLITVAVIKIA